MARVAGEQYFTPRLTRQEQLTVSQVTIRERGIDVHFVFVVRELLTLAMAETETPCLAVIGRSIGNPVRVLGK